MKMKKLFVIASLLFLLATQVSAWTFKGFNPNNVSQIHVLIRDGATKGCWTNMSEVKRYTEDKLELASSNLSSVYLLTSLIFVQHPLVAPSLIKTCIWDTLLGLNPLKVQAETCVASKNNRDAITNSFFIFIASILQT